MSRSVISLYGRGLGKGNEGEDSGRNGCATGWGTGMRGGRKIREGVT